MGRHVWSIPTNILEERVVSTFTAEDVKTSHSCQRPV